MKAIITFLFLIVAVCALAQTPQQQVAQQITDWHKNLNNADLGAVSAQYASDAVFFPTFINAAYTADERKVFLQTLIDKKPTAKLNNDQRIRVFGDVATCSGTWIFEVNNAQNQRENKPVRYLFVFEKRGGKWLIIEQHVSAFPIKN